MNDNKKSSPVSFRLPANLKEELAGRAAEFGLSPGEFARKVLIEALHNDFPTKVLAELARILRTTQAVRDDIETATLGLMISTGKQPVEVAEAWVRDNLGTEA